MEGAHSGIILNKLKRYYHRGESEEVVPAVLFGFQ